MYLPSYETERYGMTNGYCLLVFCLQKSCRGFEHSDAVGSERGGERTRRGRVRGREGVGRERRVVSGEREGWETETERQIETDTKR